MFSADEDFTLKLQRGCNAFSAGFHQRNNFNVYARTYTDFNPNDFSLALDQEVFQYASVLVH